MREIRTSGSMSGRWKRGRGRYSGTGTTERAGNTHGFPKPTRHPPDSTIYLEVSPHEHPRSSILTPHRPTRHPHPTRNRIKFHRKIRAGDLVPHEWNFRLHPDAQKAALQAIYQEIGFARSLLAYELPDGRLKLIDGHLRRDLDPNLEVDVEILDVDEAEARALLLSIDSLAALAETQDQLHQRLLETTPTISPDLTACQI
jgi:hypothetical protein